jgi:phosphatidylinositol alpha-1,6-mannosyltransferase
MTKTLVVTNDFPPRPGGIQTFVWELLVRLDPADVVVFTSTWRDPAQFDAAAPFPVVREPGSVMLPLPRTKQRAAQLLREHGCEAVLFGAAAPLGLMGDDLRDAGALRCVGLTHGHEAGWAGYPVLRDVLRNVGDELDVLTYLGDYTRQRIEGVMRRDHRARLTRLTPGVDVDFYHPGVDGAAVRERHGLADRPVIVCVSRLMPRKGQDSLIAALPRIRDQVPDAALLIVGGGPHRTKLERLAQTTGVAEHVVLTGGVPYAELPAHYAAGDVFAMPCRSRHRGLDVEGLGIVYLEAAAVGLPVVAGDSGGAPDAVLDGQTGFVVPGRDEDALVARLVQLLTDGALAQAMGRAGRAWVLDQWQWQTKADQLAGLLAGAPAP